MGRPKIVTNPVERLVDVSCTKIKFEPGDRILVQCYRPLNLESRKRLRGIIERWAGREVEVLIYDVSQMDIKVELINGQRLPRGVER